MLGLLFLVSLAAVAVWMLFPHLFSKPNQGGPRSIEVGDKKPGEGRPHRSAKYTKELLTTGVPGGETPSRLFRLSVERFGSRPAFGTRTVVKIEKEMKTITKNGKSSTKEFLMPYCSDYKFKTYAEVGDEVVRAGAGLVKLGVKPGDFVSIYANTRMEWHISAQACFAHGFPIATAYASLGTDAVAFSLDEGKIETVISELACIEPLIEATAKCPSVRLVVLMDEVETAKLEEFTKRRPAIRWLGWKQLLAEGADKKAPVKDPEPSDLAVIMYTSGSTGNPKGVMMTHGNIVAAVVGVSRVVPKFGEQDVFIAYLPLAHVLELAAEIAIVSVGASLGYGSGQRLQDSQCYSAETGKPLGDLRALRPTLMASVPLILDRIKAAIEEKVAKGSPVVQRLFKIAYALKRREWLAGRTKSLWDKVVFKNTAAAFGGRLRIMISGGAPLSAATQEFIAICFSANVIQGYGLTETCGGGTVGDYRDRTTRIAGPSIPCCEIKLVDVPDMSYLTTDRPNPRGEIAISGHNVTLGYYKNQKKTDEDFRVDGEGKRWFYTGDIGQWLPDGNLQIIDRKKDLVKLAHGEYIALGKLEAAYGGSRYVDFVCVYADSKHSVPVALVVPKSEVLSNFARSIDVPTEDFKAVCAHPKVIEEVFKSLLAEAKKAKFAPIESIAAVHLCAEPWTPATGLVTDALKLKRNVIGDRFRTVFEELYKGK